MSAVEIVRALVDAWNSHDADRILEFFHEDFENWQSPVPTVHGREAYRQHLRRWFDAYPDFRMEIVTLFADGDRVCLESRGVGRPVGTFFGVRPDEAARENRALDILELRDGKVWRERGYWDFSLWTGTVSPLAARPDLRDAAASAATSQAQTGRLCYVEFFRRLPGTPLPEFHRVANHNFHAWSEQQPDDELLANLGRTWRMGPFPYLLVWRTYGIERLDTWNELFSSGAVEEIEAPLVEVLATDEAGFYRELIETPGELDGAAYYVETFTPHAGAADAYARRAAAHGVEAQLLLERVGRLGPNPGGIAILSLPSLSDVVRLQADVPSSVVDVGLYVPTGREIL